MPSDLGSSRLERQAHMVMRSWLWSFVGVRSIMPTGKRVRATHDPGCSARFHRKCIRQEKDHPRILLVLEAILRNHLVVIGAAEASRELILNW